MNGTLPAPLDIFNGVIAYGSSAQGGTLNTYEQLCKDYGGPLNFRRAFSGNPGPLNGFTIWSTKEFDKASIDDRNYAIELYGKPGLLAYHHEPTGWKDKPKNTVREFPDPAVWRYNRDSVLADLPSNFAGGDIFMGQDARDGKAKEFIGPKLSSHVKWLGFDAYSTDVVNGRTPAQLFGPCSEVAEFYGVPWGLAEFSLAGPAAAREEWMKRAIDYWCNNKHFIFACGYGSSQGDRAPVVWNGTKSWRFDQAQDRTHPELAKTWVNLANLTRQSNATTRRVFAK